VTVYYPLHPLYGHGELRVRRRLGSGDAEQYVVEAEPDGQAVPSWMTEERRCARMTKGFDPQCSMASYLALLLLIRSTSL